MLTIIGGALLVAACGSAGPSRGASPSSASDAIAATAVPTAAVGAVCDKTDKKFDATTVSLQGLWAGDDGGIYFLRQLDTIVWWNGMADRAAAPEMLGRAWNNVARGVIQGLSIDVSWADVPRGGILDGGTMKLKVEDDGTGNVRIVKVSQQSGDFGNNTWTPCKPA
jgi:hypothetical protein